MHLRAWEIIGTISIIALGGVWHFVFDLANGWWPLAFVFPVNESVWEHLKLAFWPTLLFAVVEYWWLRDKAQNFLVAKVLSALIGPFLIVVLYYGYTAVLGRHLLALDLLIFAIAVVVAQWVSYRTITSVRDLGRYSGAAILVLGIAMAAFLTLSFFPPRLELFLDHPTGGYGIVK